MRRDKELAGPAPSESAQHGIRGIDGILEIGAHERLVHDRDNALAIDGCAYDLLYPQCFGAEEADALHEVVGHRHRGEKGVARTKAEAPRGHGHANVSEV